MGGRLTVFDGEPVSGRPVSGELSAFGDLDEGERTGMWW